MNTVVSISTPSTVESLVSFAGKTTTSQQKYKFEDTVSKNLKLPTDTSDFCGEKVLTFTFNDVPVDPTIIHAINDDYIYFSPPAKT